MDYLGLGIRLARAGHPAQHLVLMTTAYSVDKFRDGVWLIAGGFVGRGITCDLEFLEGRGGRNYVHNSII